MVPEWKILESSEIPGTWEPFLYWDGGKWSGFPSPRPSGVPRGVE